MRLSALLLVHSVEEGRKILSSCSALPPAGHATVGFESTARRRCQQLLVAAGGQVAGCEEALTGDAHGLLRNLPNLEGSGRLLQDFMRSEVH